jgi:exosortase
MNRAPAAAAPLLGIPVFPWSPLFLAGLWIWAIWSCAEHWQGNPNYSYGWAVPLLAAGFALRRYLILPRGGGEAPDAPGARVTVPGWLQAFLAIVFLGVVFLLEYSRDQMWHPEIVLWLICLLPVAATIAVFWLRGGGALARAELFPVLFFLSAVPWPPRFEQPIVSALMRWVAGATTELLHWLGIEAQTSGAAIALHSGLVGISEACSGVRSLQAGIMFGLAMGEWFLLRPLRRVVLLVLAIMLALGSNLSRTLALSLQAEWHGIDSVDRVHDLIGNIAITALIATIWIAGRLLARRARAGSALSLEQIKEGLRRFFRPMASGTPLFRALAMGFVIGMICARGGYAWVESRDHTQTAPLFVAKADDGNKFLHLSREIWNELRPTTAEYIRRESPDLPGGSADCFHFFWKPSAWNRFALVHRPDICMPGIGWKETEAPTPSDVQMNGRLLRCHFFRFRRGDAYAVELWGVWRNGEPVPLDYTAAQALGAAAAPPSVHLEGKRRSATEIIACSVIARGNPPSEKIAVALLRSVFECKSQ